MGMGWEEEICSAGIVVREGENTASQIEVRMMKIKSIKAHALSVPLKYTYAVATEPFTVATQIIVEVTTDDGLTGLGTIHGRAAKPVLEAVEKLTTS